MKSGVYVIHPGDSEFCGCFETMGAARQYAVTFDTLVSIGDGGVELDRWVKRADGNLVRTARALQKPKGHHPWRSGRYRDTRGIPPPGGRGPDGKPFNPFAVGQPDSGITTPEMHSAPGLPHDMPSGGDGKAGRIPPKETP